MRPGGPPTEPSPQTVGQDQLLEEEEARVTISYLCCHPSPLAGDAGKGRASPEAPRAGSEVGPSTHGAPPRQLLQLCARDVPPFPGREGFAVP